MRQSRRRRHAVRGVARPSACRRVRARPAPITRRGGKVRLGPAATRQRQWQPDPLHGGGTGHARHAAAATQSRRVNMESGGSAAHTRFGDSAPHLPRPVCGRRRGLRGCPAEGPPQPPGWGPLLARPSPHPSHKRRSGADAGGGAGNAVAATVAAAV